VNGNSRSLAPEPAENGREKTRNEGFVTSDPDFADRWIGQKFDVLDALAVERAVIDGQLSAIGYLVAKELTNYPSANEGRCYASQRRIAGKSGSCERTAREALRRLWSAGLLTANLAERRHGHSVSPMLASLTAR
jgi:hypothetical protein